MSNKVKRSPAGRSLVECFVESRSSFTGWRVLVEGVRSYSSDHSIVACSRSAPDRCVSSDGFSDSHRCKFMPSVGVACDVPVLIKEDKINLL